MCVLAFVVLQSLQSPVPLLCNSSVAKKHHLDPSIPLSSSSKPVCLEKSYKAYDTSDNGSERVCQCEETQSEQAEG